MRFKLGRSAFALFSVRTERTCTHFGIYNPTYWVFGAGWEPYEWCMFQIGMGPIFMTAGDPDSFVAETLGSRLYDSEFGDIVFGMPFSRRKRIGLSFSRTGVRVEDYLDEPDDV